MSTGFNTGSTNIAFPAYIQKEAQFSAIRPFLWPNMHYHKRGQSLEPLYGAQYYGGGGVSIDQRLTERSTFPIAWDPYFVSPTQQNLARQTFKDGHPKNPVVYESFEDAIERRKQQSKRETDLKEATLKRRANERLRGRQILEEARNASRKLDELIQITKFSSEQTPSRNSEGLADQTPNEPPASAQSEP